MARYFRRKDGQSFWAWVPAIANLAAPTAAEINLGTNLTQRISNISGFKYKNKPIETPDLASSFDSTIPGPDVAEESELMFYDDDLSVALQTLLAGNTAGFMVISPYAKSTTLPCRTWKLTSTGVNDDWGLDAKAAQFIVGFAVPTRPTMTAAFPSGVTI